MILLFNKIPVSLERKVAEFVNIVKAAYGSDFYDVEGSRWFGDNLTTDALFPQWIIQNYKEDTNNVVIVQLFKSYLRWLFSVEYGYGAAIPWENMASVQKVPEKLMLGFADFYFPGADFSSGSNLHDLVPNLKKFILLAEQNYVKNKGTADSIKYLLTTLIGIDQDSCTIQTGSPFFIIVRANVQEKYKPFLNKYVYPAGSVVLYESP